MPVPFQGDPERLYFVRMTTSDQLESALLKLPAAERERLAMFAWESLENAQDWPSDPQTDSEGIAIANQRDGEIESNTVRPLDRREFIHRTRDPAE
jgi:Putative addiction module component